MLPALANYFAVSVDELIGMEEITSASKLDEINQKWAENRSNGKHKENVELMRDALKIYPILPLLYRPTAHLPPVLYGFFRLVTNCGST